MTQASTLPGQVMPAAFFGHGNPMNALEVNRYTAAWRAFGQAVPRPRAIRWASTYAGSVAPSRRFGHRHRGLAAHGRAPVRNVRAPRRGV